MQMNWRSFLKMGLVTAAAGLPVAGAADTGNLFPPDYFSRFGSIEVLASSTSGFGVRAFPLPTPLDLRVSLAKRPNYWEYALSTRQKDTTFLIGVLDNGDTATAGRPRLEITHDPWKGFQFSGVAQGPGFHSRASVGYATLLANDRVRFVNDIGVAFQNEVVAPYTHSEIGGGYSQPISNKVNAGIQVTGRLYTFPTHQKYQGSVDITPSIEVRPTPQLTLQASHMERFVNGQVAIPDLNLTRYQETNASLSYRLGGTADFSVGMLRTRVKEAWREKQTYLYNDVLFRVAALPVLVGPSIGYQWDQNNKANTRWIFSLSTAPK